MEWEKLLGVGLTALTGVVGVVVWLIRLEGRINMITQRNDDCARRSDERYHVMQTAIANVDRDLNASTSSLFQLVGDLDRIVHRLEGIIDSTRRP